MPMDNVTLENTQQSISSRDAKSVASVMVNGKWVNLSDTLEQANVKSDVGAVSKQVAEQQTVITSTVAQADSAVAYANDAIEKSKVNSQAIVAQSEAISEAKSAIDSATAEIQQAIANAASDAANIRADVAQVQNEVNTAKAANSASVEALKSDVSATKQDLADVHDSLTKAQAAAEESQKAIDKSIAQINSDIEQDRKDIASAQQANADTAKQLDAYSKQAQDQGKTIKSIQDKQDGFTATLADVQGNVTQVSDKVDGLSANLKDAQNNVASVKAQADQLSATLTDHAKSIATLTASAKEVSSTLEDADGRLSKVEQTAQTNSSTLSDVQGDLSQVKQDATTLTSTLKDAQGNISTLQQKADGVSSQLASAQGDITSLQTDVKGIKATLVSHEGDIHTLQADSKSLHDSMQDVQGNISTLQKTSTDVTSELQDHTGRISKVEQTASTLTNEFSDQDGRLSKVEQTATGTQQTVANQQGQINAIKTDADGIHETITGQGGQIATINTTLNGLNTKYEGVSGDLSKLSGTVATNSTQIKQNKQAISLKADQSTVDNLSGEVSQNTAQLKVQADQISSKVSSSDFKTLNDKVNGAISSIQKNSTAIDQTNKQIILKADQTEVDQVKQTATKNSSRLDVMDGQIRSRVTSTDVNNIVDSKGFATTNTVQSLITQKAGTINESIVKLNQTVKQGAENNVQLVRKSDFEDGDKGSWNAQCIVSATNPAPPSELGQSGMKVLQTNVRDSYEDDIWYSVKPGEKFDVDFWCAPSTKFYTTFGLQFVDKDKGNWQWLGVPTDQSGQWKHYTGTITAPANSAFAKPWYQMEKPWDNTANTAWLAKPSIRRQNATTVAAIQQITASIDGLQLNVINYKNNTSSQITQLSNTFNSKIGDAQIAINDLKDKTLWKRTGSIDLNSAVSQQKLFVTGGSNLPPGDYWWFVQVESGGYGRVIQYAVSDRDNKHFSRQCSWGQWSAWTKDATESEITQLSDAINLRVQKGDVISQINQEAGGNTLIQVSNGNGSLILDAANTIVKGKEWIPVAAIADLTADQVQAGTLKGVKVDFRDSTGTGMIADGSTLTFDVSNTPAGYLSYNGMPVAELPDGSGGNELAIRYGLSTAIIPDDNSGAQATFSKAAQKIAYMTGTDRGKQILSGLEVHSNNHHWLCAVNSDATCNRFEVNDRDGLNIAWHDNTHFWISDGNAKLYKDNDDSPTATKLEVHGWAWINGWVEAAGHSQHSALSTKTDIQPVDDDKMLKMVNDTDLTTFLYKTDVANGETHRHIGPIIDDVHDVAQYQTPQDFIAPNGVSRDDDNMIGALFGAVKALTKRIETLESKVG